MLAIHPQSETRDGDADLGRGDVAILEGRIFQDKEHALSQATALGRLMLDAGARSADDGELSRHEETVGQDEEQDDRDRDQNLHHRASSDETGTTRLAATDCGIRSLTRSTSNS